MRLLKTNSNAVFDFEQFYEQNVPRYAILSHTWSQSPEDEVLYSDVVQGSSHQKPAYNKVRAALFQACQDGFQYCWIDTCCIDKSSSAELSEAINSMFRWYQNASRCYAFLEDVSIPVVAESSYLDAVHNEMRDSRWFTRGWTLQELLAPVDVHFYPKEWLNLALGPSEQRKQSLGSKFTLYSIIAQITGIAEAVIEGKQAIGSASVAQRMSWAAHRETSRPEDEAYCLMGLFGVNMPML